MKERNDMIVFTMLASWEETKAVKITAKIYQHHNRPSVWVYPDLIVGMRVIPMGSPSVVTGLIECLEHMSLVKNYVEIEEQIASQLLKDLQYAGVSAEWIDIGHIIVAR